MFLKTKPSSVEKSTQSALVPCCTSPTLINFIIQLIMPASTAISVGHVMVIVCSVWIYECLVFGGLPNSTPPRPQNQMPMGIPHRFGCCRRCRSHCTSILSFRRYSNCAFFYGSVLFNTSLLHNMKKNAIYLYYNICKSTLISFIHLHFQKNEQSSVN